VRKKRRQRRRRHRPLLRLISQRTLHQRLRLQQDLLLQLKEGK
jgi:hypothetical protein